jgi:hypothetical protein
MTENETSCYNLHMRRRGFLKMRILLTALLVCVLSPAYGMVYTWTDAGGLTHFTNKEYEVPARYRPRTKTLYPEQVDSTAPQQGVQTPEVQPTAPTQQAKPEEPPKTAQPVITPEPQKTPSDRLRRKARRVREPSEEE